MKWITASALHCTDPNYHANIKWDFLFFINRYTCLQYHSTHSQFVRFWHGLETSPLGRETSGYSLFYFFIFFINTLFITLMWNETNAYMAIYTSQRFLHMAHSVKIAFALPVMLAKRAIYNAIQLYCTRNVSLCQVHTLTHRTYTMHYSLRVIPRRMKHGQQHMQSNSENIWSSSLVTKSMLILINLQTTYASLV